MSRALAPKRQADWRADPSVRGTIRRACERVVNSRGGWDLNCQTLTDEILRQLEWEFGGSLRMLQRARDLANLLKDDA